MSKCLSSDTPRIYVACLAAYVNGNLHGEWINCDHDSDEIRKDIKTMLSRSPMAKFQACEEWAIHSYEGFQGITIEEYESIDRVVEIAQKLKEHGEAFAAYLDHYNLEDINDFEDRYQGSYESKRAFTEEHYSELIDTVEKAGLDSMYIDFEVWARDLFISDFTGVRKEHETLYVFRNG
jgi:antirestriction protein